MKVKELIEFLSKLDPDYTVFTTGDDSCSSVLTEDDISVYDDRIHL